MLNPFSDVPFYIQETPREGWHTVVWRGHVHSSMLGYPHCPPDMMIFAIIREVEIMLRTLGMRNSPS